MLALRHSRCTNRCATPPCTEIWQSCKHVSGLGHTDVLIGVLLPQMVVRGYSACGDRLAHTIKAVPEPDRHTNSCFYSNT